MPHPIPFDIVPTVKILVVADTRTYVPTAGSFNFAQTQSGFDLEMALSAIKAAPLPWVKFDIVTAHRDTTASPVAQGSAAAQTAQYQGFRFDALHAGFSLGSVDQIWSFGFPAAQDGGAQPTVADLWSPTGTVERWDSIQLKARGAARATTVAHGMRLASDLTAPTLYVHCKDG
jgi:hypothetical protein